MVVLLCCLQLRLAGNALAGGGDLEGAISKYQQVRLLKQCLLAQYSCKAWHA
jgi:hypothetical protein